MWMAKKSFAGLFPPGAGGKDKFCQFCCPMRFFLVCLLVFVGPVLALAGDCWAKEKFSIKQGRL